MPGGAYGDIADVITPIGAAFKTAIGELLSGEKIAQLLFQNMTQLEVLTERGELDQQQIMQVQSLPVRCVHSELIACTPLAEGVRGQSQSH